QHVALQDLARHHVERPADQALHHVALTVAGADRGLRGAEIDADEQHVVLLAHVALPFVDGAATARLPAGTTWADVAWRDSSSVYASMPWRRASAICWR